MKKIFKMMSPFNAYEEIPTVFFVIKKLLAFLLIFLTASILAEGIIIIIHYVMGYDLLQGEMLPIQTMNLMKYYGYAIFIFVAVLYCKVVEKRSIRSMGFSGKLIGYLKGTIIGVALLAISMGIMVSMGKITYHGVLQHIDYSLIVAFLGAFIVQGAMEEVLCRGFLMISLSKKVSIPIAISISSLAFAVPHFSTLFMGDFIFGLVGIINLLFVSIIFSLLILRDKNIWIACGMHSIWNFFLFNVFGLNLSGAKKRSTAILDFRLGEDSLMNGGAYGIEASIITTLVLFVFVAILVFLRYQSIKKDSK